MEQKKHKVSCEMNAGLLHTVQYIHTGITLVSTHVLDAS